MAVWGNAQAVYVPDWPPDPLASPQFYDGIVTRRLFAYFVDFLVLTMIMIGIQIVLGVLTIASLGLLWPLHFLVVPILIALAYHGLQLSSPAAATLGMRMFGLRGWTVGATPPSLARALIHTGALYLVLSIFFPLQLVALFNRHHRAVHDYIAGIVILRAV